MSYFQKFYFIENKKLCKILVLDYKEVLTGLKRKAYKSAVVLSGGITEAVLKDLGTHKSNRVSVEKQYKKIARKKDDVKVEDMDLFYLIKSLENLKLISNVDASAANILRDHRNMIHPFKYLKRPNKKDALKVKELLDDLIYSFGSDGAPPNYSRNKGVLFLTHEGYRKRRERQEYREIVGLLYKKKKVSFVEIRSLPSIENKDNPSKSAASYLAQLRSMDICDYDKRSWQDAPIKRYEHWVFNENFRATVEDYLKNT